MARDYYETLGVSRDDLLAEVKIMVPPRLSDRERELFSELAAASTFDPRRSASDDARGPRR